MKRTLWCILFVCFMAGGAVYGLPPGGGSGSGDMTKAVYDADNNGKIDADSVDDSSSIYVPNSLFDAYTVLMATTDNTPLAVVLGEETVLGRVTGQPIAALTLGVAAGNVLKLPADPGAHTLFGFDNTTNTYKPITIGATLSFDQVTSTLSVGDLSGVYSILAHNHTGTYQPADADLTTYAGITPSADIQTFLGYANLAAIKAGLSIDDLVTLTGVADGSTHLGTFTGSTITDNQTIKAALQLLETAVEGVAGGHDAVTINAGIGAIALTGANQVLTAHANVEALADYADPNADRIWFWDDSESTFAGLAVGNSIAITTTILDTIQDIRTTATPRFARIGVGQAADGTNPIASSGFSVDPDGDVAAKSFTTTKASGVAGSALFYEANSTDTNGTGWKGPASRASDLYLQFPDADPTANQFLLFPAPTAGTATAAWKTYGSFDNGATGAGFIDLFEDSDNGTASTRIIGLADQGAGGTLTVGVTFTDTKWCSYAAATGFTCNEDAPAGSGDITAVGSCATGSCASIGNGSTGGGYVDFLEDTDNGTNYVRLKAPDTLSGDFTATLPSETGTIMTKAQKFTQCTTIKDPVATSDHQSWRAPAAITITNMHCLATGGTSLTGQFQECDANGANCADVDSDMTCTAGSNVNDDGTLSNGSIDSGDYILWKTTSVSGTQTELIACFDYTYN